MSATNRENHFPALVRGQGGIPLMFEVMPPRRDATEESVQNWRDRIVQAVAVLPVDAINIPEVREETRNGERTYNYARRMKPREFGSMLTEAMSRPINLVINRVVVYRPVAQQQDWLENSHRDWGIRNLILVGGESSRVTYPGPSVTSTARLIAQEINPLLPEPDRWLCGGICIPNRRSSDPERDEPRRLIHKAQSGMEFFTTQVIYESDHICRLLNDYAEACEREGEEPKRLFLSLSPVGQPKQIEFIRWLGVDVPPGVEAELLQDAAQIGPRSLDICCRIFQRVLEFNEQQSKPVPLGLNISPLMRSNFDLGVELADRLAILARK